MKASVRRSTRWWAGALAAILAFGVATAPAAHASEQGQAPAAAKSLRAATAARLASLDTQGAVRFAQESQPAATEGGGSFFKSKKGVVVVILMAGAITWAIASRSKDAVHSPAR